MCIFLVYIYTLFVLQIVKRDQKSFVINISKEYSIVSQFTSFVAIEEREKVRKSVSQFSNSLSPSLPVLMVVKEREGKKD